MNPGEETRDWSYLPDEVIYRTAKLFNSLADFYSFRNTCHNWRVVAIPSAETMASQSPIVLLPLENYSGRPMEAFIDVSTRKFHRVPRFFSWRYRKVLNFSHGYLAMVMNNGLIRLRHIFTGDEIRLPPGNLQTTCNIIFSDNPSSPDCIFVLFEPWGQIIEYCKRGDECWTPMRIRYLILTDMVFHQGKLYSLFTRRDFFGTQVLMIIDPYADPNITYLSRPQNFSDQSLMVSIGEELLLSCRSRYYRWDTESERWILINSFGGQAIFISGSQFTATVDPTTIHGIEPDFCYIYSAEHDILDGSSVVDQRQWTMHADFNNLIHRYAECSDRPVWVFPSQCFQVLKMPGSVIWSGLSYRSGAGAH